MEPGQFIQRDIARALGREEMIVVVLAPYMYIRSNIVSVVSVASRWDSPRTAVSRLMDPIDRAKSMKGEFFPH